MSSMGMAGAVAPALLKSRSRRPNASLILAKSARTERGSPTSVGTGSIVPPEGSPDAAVRSSSAARRPASATEYPAACKARLTARPMPLPAPVTSAILPVFAIFVSIVRQPARAASWLHAPRHPLRAQPDPLDGYHQVRHVPADALGKAMYRDRTKSVPDKMLGTHGDAAFADYVWLVSYTYRLPSKGGSEH